jgi:hypothetical protein
LLFDKAKIKEKLGLNSEAKSLYHKIYATFNEAKANIGESKLMPFDFYVLAYIDERINKSHKKAKENYQKGYCAENLPSFKAFECLAFQRKCLRKIEKIEENEGK